MLDYNAKPSGRRLNIMITYDDPAEVAAVSTFFNNSGYNVSHCRSFDDFIAGEFPDLDYLLIDITTAQFSTFHELSQLRRVLPQIKILAVTDRFETDQIMNALDAGVNDYMVKPFSLRELLDRIKSL